MVTKIRVATGGTIGAVSGQEYALADRKSPQLMGLKSGSVIWGPHDWSKAIPTRKNGLIRDIGEKFIGLLERRGNWNAVEIRTNGITRDASQKDNSRRS